MKEGDRFTFIHFLMALAIIAPKVGQIDFPIIILSTITFYLSLTIRINFNLPVRFYLIIVMWILLLMLGLFAFLINGSLDEQFILKPLRQIILLSLYMAIVFRIGIKTRDVFRIVIVAAIINCIIIGAQLVAHNFFSNPGFLISEAFNEEMNVPYRKPGLMAGFTHAGFLSLIAIQCLLNFAKSIDRIKFILLLAILTLSLIVTARTALLLSFIPFSLFLFLGIRSKKILGRIILFLLFGITCITYVINKLPEDTSKHAFELFINLAENKSFSTNSSEATYDSYILPEKLSTFVFGNGRYMRTDLNTNVDDGFQILLYGGGLFYLLLSIIIFCFYAIIAKKGGNNYFERYCIMSIFVILIIANYKVDTIFTRVMSDITALLVAVGLYKAIYKANLDVHTRSIVTPLPQKKDK